MTYLEFLSLMVLYMAWIVLLVRMMMADETSLHDTDDRAERRSR